MSKPAKKPIWIKKANGTLVLTHKGSVVSVVPDKANKDWFALKVDGVKRADGGKQWCKDQAARKMHPNGVVGTSVGATRKPKEKVGDWFVRMAAEYGYSPFTLAHTYILIEAGIDPDSLTEDRLAAWAKAGYEGYKEFVRKNNLRYAKGKPCQGFMVLLPEAIWCSDPNKVHSRESDRKLLLAAMAGN